MSKKKAVADNGCMTAQDIFGAAVHDPVRVDLAPDLKGHVYVRVLRGFEMDAYEASLVDLKTGERNMANFRAKLVVRCACDASGKRLFTSEQVDKLGESPGRLVERIWKAADALNSSSPESQKRAVKN